MINNVSITATQYNSPKANITEINHFRFLQKWFISGAVKGTSSHSRYRSPTGRGGMTTHCVVNYGSKNSLNILVLPIRPFKSLNKMRLFYKKRTTRVRFCKMYLHLMIDTMHPQGATGAKSKRALDKTQIAPTVFSYICPFKHRRKNK